MPRRSKQPDVTDPAERILELETELRQRDDKIKELTRDLAETQDLLDQQREHVEEVNRLFDNWIDVFDMQKNEHGNWIFDPRQTELWNRHKALWGEHQKLIRDWNKLVPKYNAAIIPRERGRPLAASENQRADVLKRHKAGRSLRAIAAATSLSVRTVRTIIDRKEGKGRASKRTNEVRRKEFNKLRAAAYRARKKGRDRLPGQITELQKAGEALIKAAKGLGR